MGRHLRLLLAVGLLLSGVLGISFQRAKGQAKSSSPVTPVDYLKWRIPTDDFSRNEFFLEVVAL